MYLFIETDRLTIRPIEATDSDFIFSLTNSKGWLEFIGDRNIRTSIDAENYIRKIVDNPDYFYSVFEAKNTGQPIGIVTFLKRPDQPAPDFGFAMLPEFERNGFALEASQAYLQHLLSIAPGLTILAITKPENAKSINLLRKLGFAFKEIQSNADGERLSIYQMGTS